MRIVPLTAELLRVMPLKDAPIGTMIDHAAQAIKPGLGWALLDGGYIAGAGGVVSMWHGRALAWVLPSVFARPRHYAVAGRFAQRWLTGLQRDTAFRRIECQVLARFDAGLRFAAALGFEREGDLEAWGPNGEDFIQFKRLAPALLLRDAAE